MFGSNGPAFTGGVAVTVSRLINRNVVAERGRTSMRLEPELWEALLEICGRERQDMSSLVRKVEALRPAVAVASQWWKLPI